MAAPRSVAATARQSWNVVEADRSLIVLPLWMVLAYAVGSAVVFGPFALWALDTSSTTVLVVGAALVSLPMNVVSTFFGVAFVHVLRSRAAGGRSTTADGIAFARTRLRPILGWALIATVVGLAIQALQRVRGGGVAARIAGWLIGATWSLATLFVVPVLAETDLGPLGAARESAQVIRKRWGETVVGSTGINVAFGLLFVPVAIVGVIGLESFGASPGFGFAAVVLAIGLGILVFSVQYAVDMVFRVALFDFATTGAVLSGFSASDLQSGLRSKKGFFRRWH